MGWDSQRLEQRGLSRPRTLILALGLLAFSMAGAEAQEVRTWADASGKFKIQAKFVSAKDGVVTLEQTDGENIEIELKSLAAGDQKYVADLLKAEANSPFKKKAASPFRKKAAGSGEMDDSASAGAGDGRLVKPSWSNVQTIPSAPSSSEWKVPVSSAAAPSAPAKLRVAGIPPKSNFFEGSKGVAINAAGTKAVVGYAGKNPGVNQKGFSRVILCDLEAGGRPLGVGAQAEAFAPLALSDDGLQVLMRTDEFGPGGHDRLEFWNMGKSGLVKGDQFLPYEGANGSNGGDKDVRWAAYLDAKRLATISEKGNLVIWQIKPLKPLASMDLESGCTPALSPDRKLLAFATPKDIGILDTTSLEVLAAQPAPMPNMAWTSFAFSPSGKRLACKVFVSKLYVYDLALGAQYREISLQGLNAQNPAVFTDDDHVILGEHTLVDLETQVRLWQYNGNERVVQSNGLCWFEVAAGHPNQAGALVAAKVPTPTADQALKRAMSDPNFFILKQGKSVALDVNGIPDASQRNTVAQALTANLAKNGVTVASGSPLIVQAALEPGKEQEIAYRSIGRGGRNVDRFKIRPWTGKIKFVYNGQAAWETSASTVPFFDFAHLEKNESLQDHVKKFEQPNYQYFGNVELPKLLTRPTGNGAGTMGISQVTTSGVR
jgi:SLA1 homology domain 1, SHD1